MALVLPLLSGCVMWRSQIDPHTLRYEARAATPGTAKRLLLTISASHGGADAAAERKRLEIYQRIGKRVLAESGYFSAVDTELADPDLELVLDIVEVESFSPVLQVVWVVTAFIFPMYDSVAITARGGFYSGSGAKLGDVAVDQSASSLISLALLPATPSYFVIQNSAREDLFEGALGQLLEARSAWP